MLNNSVFVYLDDILIFFFFFSRDLSSHIQTVRKVLSRLLPHQLFVKAEKCGFHRSSVSFLEYIITEKQIIMYLEKVRAIIDWPTPLSRKDVQRFLGFANFCRKFIRNFSSVAAPLHAHFFQGLLFMVSSSTCSLSVSQTVSLQLLSSSFSAVYCGGGRFQHWNQQVKAFWTKMHRGDLVVIS